MIHQVNKNGVSGRRFTETDVKHFNSGAQRTITNIARGIPSMGNRKKMNSFTGVFQRFCLYITEQLSKMLNFSQVFFKDFVDRFGTIYLKNGFL